MVSSCVEEASCLKLCVGFSRECDCFSCDSNWSRVFRARVIVCLDVFVDLLVEYENVGV